MDSTPRFRTQHYRPYFTEEEVQYLTEKQRGKVSQAQEDRSRQQACSFIDAVASRLGFPKRTTATAQIFYHRFHLYFHRKSLSYYDVTLAALYVSTKINDTLKKPRDLLMAGYIIRYPDLAAKSKVVGGEIEMDQATVTADTEKILAIERLMLEVICFNFTVIVPFPYVIKFSRALKASKSLTQFAWRIASDSNRTMVPLLYPPHTVALACVYLAALLTSFELPEAAPTEPGACTCHELATMLGEEGEWENQFHARAEDLDEIAHALIDLLHSCSSMLMAASTSTSPSTPATPATPRTPSSPRAHGYSHHSQNAAGLNPLPAPPYRPDQLIRLKIDMRSKSLRPKKKRKLDKDSSEFSGKGAFDGMGDNEGTTRFLFGPPALAEEVAPGS